MKLNIQFLFSGVLLFVYFCGGRMWQSCARELHSLHHVRRTLQNVIQQFRFLRSRCVSETFI